MTLAPITNALAKKLNAFLPLSSDELSCLDDLQARPFQVARGQQLTEEGQTGHKAFVLLAGWACSYKDLANGGRQIISFPVPGDCVGIRSILLRTADHSFSALTPAVVSSIQGSPVPVIASGRTHHHERRTFGRVPGSRRNLVLKVVENLEAGTVGTAGSAPKRPLGSAQSSRNFPS